MGVSLDLLVFCYVQELLAKGADPDCRDRYRETPLHKAAEGGHSDVIKVLLDAGKYCDQVVKIAFLILQCSFSYLIHTIHSLNVYVCRFTEYLWQQQTLN